MTGFNWCVVVAYDCSIGNTGAVLSKHKTYDLAKAAAKKTGFYEFLSIREFNNK